jgi:ATP-dependent Lon protease
MVRLKYTTTKDIEISKCMVNQVIGQEEGVTIIKKAAKQRRNVLLIGSPGTGKSLIGQALAELLPKEKLIDILAFPNLADDNLPLIKTLPKGKGKDQVTKAKIQAMGSFRNQNILIFIFVIIASLIPYYFYKKQIFPFDSPVIYAASMITSIVFIIGVMLFLNLTKKARGQQKNPTPKLLIDNSTVKKAPFHDATGAHAGALLGDVLHDPLQSGGLGTPPHERLIPGMIHRASGGVLFIDEISTLSPHSQQELLSALQEKKYPITGQSEKSSGAMTRTQPVPCDFILVAAGNLETVKHMHPALRSRIRGYGYEVYMNNTMDDSSENQDNLAIFVAQEVEKDGKIPHFSKQAVQVIIQEARKMASTSGKLTVRLRELGGLVRASGDLALEDTKATFVQSKHVLQAKKLSRTLEQQIADKYIEAKKKYEVIKIKGKEIGRVNGLAVIGSESAFSGIVLPIESEVTPGGKKPEFVATGKLGEIAKEAVKNVSAIILKYFGEDLREKYDVYTQFIQSHEGVEGDSASIAVATSIISALKKVPIRQDTAMTGSLSVRGDVLAVGGVTAKVEAAIDAGLKRVIIPKANEKDIVIRHEKLKEIKIIPVERIEQVLKYAIDWKGNEKILKKLNGRKQ